MRSTHLSIRSTKGGVEPAVIHLSHHCCCRCCCGPQLLDIMATALLLGVGIERVKTRAIALLPGHLQLRHERAGSTAVVAQKHSCDHVQDRKRVCAVETRDPASPTITRTTILRGLKVGVSNVGVVLKRALLISITITHYINHYHIATATVW